MYRDTLTAFQGKESIHHENTIGILKRHYIIGPYVGDVEIQPYHIPV